MSGPSNQHIAKMLQGMIVERQRLLIREANYLRALVGLAPVRAVEKPGLDARDPGAPTRRGDTPKHSGP